MIGKQIHAAAMNITFRVIYSSHYSEEYLLAMVESNEKHKSLKKYILAGTSIDP